MRSCETYERLASMAIDGEATREEQAELAAHLETCPACRTYFEDIKRIHESFVREEVVLPEGFAVRVMDQVRKTGQDRSGEEEKTVIRFPRWRRWAALAACCAVVVSCAWFLRSGGGRDAMAPVSLDAAGDDINLRPADAAGQMPALLSDDPVGAVDDAGPNEADLDNTVPDEAPPPVPDEYAALAKSAVRDNAGEGKYQPLEQTEPSAAAAASPPPESGLSGEEAPSVPVTIEPAAAPDGASPDSSVEDTNADRTEDSGKAEEEEEPPDGANEPEIPAAVPEEEADPLEELPGPEDAVEPAEVIGVPESGVLIAYGSAAQNWVENVLGLEWAVGGSYPLTAEQYGDLLQTLDEAGELYTIAPGEGYCLMTG